MLDLMTSKQLSVIFIVMFFTACTKEDESIQYPAVYNSGAIIDENIKVIPKTEMQEIIFLLGIKLT